MQIVSVAGPIGCAAVAAVRLLCIIERNASRAHVLIYNRFKNSRVVSAEWMSTMMRSYVLSKMSYLAEIWTDSTKKRLP